VTFLLSFYEDQMFNFSSCVILLEPLTTHRKPTLNPMAIYSIHIVSPNNAHVFPPCVQTTQHVTSFIPTYQPPPLWIVFFLAIIISPPSIFINFLNFLTLLLHELAITTSNVNSNPYHNFQHVILCHLIEYPT
jgi:hypothetical protein